MSLRRVADLPIFRDTSDPKSALRGVYQDILELRGVINNHADNAPPPPVTLVDSLPPATVDNHMKLLVLNWLYSGSGNDQFYICLYDKGLGDYRWWQITTV